MDNHFEIQFRGDHRTATLAARQFFSSIQLGKGVWKKQEVLGPMESQIRYSISPDRNGAQVRKEVLAKHLQNFLKPLISKEVWLKKQTGTILVDKRKLCSLIIVDEYDVRLDWYHLKAADLKLDVGLIESQFKSEFILGSGRQSS